LSIFEKLATVSAIRTTNFMASEHPFQLLFETLGRVPSACAESVNRQAYEILTEILTVPVEKTGRCILLRAPRAGHGKTHLLSRIQHSLSASHEFIPLQAAFGSRIDAASVTDDTLRTLVRQLPAAGGLTALDLVTRRLFASALQPLVGSGEVPCQDREGALTALRTRPVETFDFHHPNAVTAHWARENFEVLSHRLSLELAQRGGLPVAGVSFWVDALFRFASTPVENPSRVRALADEVHGMKGLEMERLEAILGLLTQLMRVVLVADDVEGFSTDETAALRLAAFLGSLRQPVERLDVILSLNQDVWVNAFVPRLSGGLADRLSEVVVELDPLTQSDMLALLESRAPGLGQQILQRIDAQSAGTHARGLIRAAGMAWLKASAGASEVAPVTPPPAPEALPPVVPAPMETVLPQVAAIVPEPMLPVEPPAVVMPPPQAPAASPFVAAVLLEPAHPFAVQEVQQLVPLKQAAEPVTEAPAAAWPPPTFTPPAPAEAEIPAPPKAEPPAPAIAHPWGAPPSHPAVISQAVESIASPFNRVEPPPAATQTAPLTNVADIIQALSQQAPAAQPAPAAPPFQAVAESPFRIIHEPAVALAEPVIHLTPGVVEANAPAASPFQQVAPQELAAVPPVTSADTDRVDDLLKQFRERYGKGSL
jgi:hypothetical protein